MNTFSYNRAPIAEMLGMVAAIVSIGFFVANDFDHRAIHWGRMQVALFFVLPLLPSILLLIPQKIRHIGVAYTVGISNVASIVMILPTGLLILFWGAETPEQRVDTLALLGYTLSMLLIAALGLWNYFQSPSNERQGKVALLSLIGAALYAIFGWGFFQNALHMPYDRAALIREFNDRQALQAINSIAECARNQSEKNRLRGYPASMDNLLASGCMVGKLQRGQSANAAGADGYAFYYYAAPPDANGKVARFAACARAEREEFGTRAIGIDTDGNFNELESPAWKPAPTCFAVWAGNDDRHYLNALAGCLLSGAALHPGQGYPQSLFGAQGFHSGACDFMQQEVHPNGRARTERGVIEYLPEPAFGGVIPGYKLVLYPQTGGVALEVDHLGRVREIQMTNAEPTLESIESERPSDVLKNENISTKLLEMSAICESGNLVVCEDLGDFEMNNDHPVEARRWWDHACERGRLQSCLLTRRYNPSNDSGEASTYKERCVQGEKHYCEKLEELVNLLTPQIEELRRLGGKQISDGVQTRVESKRLELASLCDAGNAELCENLGDLEWDTHRPDEASRWWDRACEFGQLRACLLGDRYNPAKLREQVLALRSQCRQSVSEECRKLESLVRERSSSIKALLAKGR